MSSAQPLMYQKSSLSDEELREALSGCENEPIHIPGSIQPHGFLLVLSDELKIIKCSSNLFDAFGKLSRDLIGKNLCDLIAAEKITELKTLITQGALNPIRYTSLHINFDDDDTIYDAVMHRSGPYLVLELEKNSAAEFISPQQSLYQEAMTFSKELQKVRSQDSLFKYVVSEIRRITGFARVKLYKFDEKWNGQVIAESKEDHMHSYLGLNFPASDIPKQARLLYSKNYLRLIPNVSFEPIQIIPDDKGDDGKPIDLSFSCLRSVSPVHMEYLKNMGVEASMSISVMQNEKLWGLIACHHHESHHIPYPVRMMAELMAHTFSSFLSNYAQSDKDSELEYKQTCIRELKLALVPDRNLMEALKVKHQLILNAVNADGVIVYLGGKHFAFGLIPEMSFVKELVNWMEKNHDNQVFASNSISRDTDLSVQGQTMASGVLAVPVSTNITDYIMWFRQEKVDQVSWAGKPEKNITKTDAGFQLTPRASFKRWQENVRGFSRKWSKADIEAARSVTKLVLSKRYEDSLKQADYDLQSILDNSSTLIYINDKDGRLVKINNAAVEAFELNGDVVVGQHYRDVLDKALSDLIDQHQKIVLFEQKSMSFEKNFVMNGKQFHLAAVKFPLYDINNDVYGLCTIATDISELKHAQEELERSNKELEQVAFIASHDLQEPIRIISNFTQLLKADYGDKLDDRAIEYMDFTLTYTERMKNLIHDLLQYSRVNRIEGSSPEIDAHEEINKVLKQFELDELYSDATIKVEGDMPKIFMKSEHFACLIQNFVGNAIKYRDKDRLPEVAINVEEDELFWTFNVSDNGIGIKKEYQDKIFKIFQRLHKATDYEGTGIGLAICSRIIERYNGKIWVESEQNKGSIFYFQIPKKTASMS